MLNQPPKPRERAVYVAALYVLTFCLVLVMGQSYRQAAQIRRLRQERAATADDLLLLRTQNETQRNTFRKDHVYIGWLQESLSRYEAGDPKVWRAFALKRSEVIGRETPEERAQRQYREIGYQLLTRVQGPAGQE